MEQIQSIIYRGAVAGDAAFSGAASAAITQDAIFEAAATGDSEKLACLIDLNGFDLTTLHSGARETVLHRAISAGQDDVVMMLLDRAGDDPLILNAKDKDGYTPLMRATERRNVPMMQALVQHNANAGEYVDVSAMPRDFGASLLRTGAEEMNDEGKVTVNLDVLIRDAKASYKAQLAETSTGDRNRQADAKIAQFLVEARGDLSQAFKLSLELGEGYAEEFYLGAGASTVPALTDLSCPRNINRMIERGYVRADDVLEALAWAKETGNQALTKELTSYAVVNAILHDEMGECSDEDKIAVLKRFVDAMGPRSSQLLREAELQCIVAGREARWNDRARRSEHFEHMTLLVKAGAPTTDALAAHAKAQDRDALRTFVRTGADVPSAVAALSERGERTISRLLALLHALDDQPAKSENSAKPQLPSSSVSQ